MRSFLKILYDASLGAWVFTAALALVNFCVTLWGYLHFHANTDGTGSLLRLVLLFAVFLFTLIMSIRAYRQKQNSN